MKRKIVISYQWWRSSANKRIKPTHVEALEETAMMLIQEMMGQGYVCGDLHDHVRMGEEDGEDGTAYTGYWEIKKT